MPQASAEPLARQPAPSGPDLKTKPAPVQQTSKGGTSPPSKRKSNMLLWIVLAVAAVGAGIAIWILFPRNNLPEGFAGGNGRLEAKQIYISNKYAGRVAEVLFNEGDTIEAGQVVARMDTSALDAQLREAQAQIRASQDNRNVALAQIGVRQADYDYAQKQFQRSQDLVTRGSVSQREAEVDQASMLAAKAQLTGAQATATQSISTIAAAQATADRLSAEIKDAVLVSPIRARIETRLAEPGEVLPAGGRVFSVNDLSDVYMYVYLPEIVTGKVPLGSEARIVLDAAPQYPIRAFVSYVSPMAQFTPKTVETAEERHNLTFRVKLQIPRERLRQFEPLVKFGLPGMGYVRYTNADWPANLQVKPVPADLWKTTGSSSAPQPAGPQPSGSSGAQ
jgi:HlyD family secretion protein